MHTSGFAKLLARAGDEAKMGFKVHPHMLRHACGYALANKGIDTRTLQAYLGHRSSTTRYAALAPGVQKHLGQGVAKFALYAIEVERSYPLRHRMPALTNRSR